MTAVQTSTAAARPAAGSGSRVIPVVRLHFVNRFSMLVLPWIILGFIFLVNLAIWWIVMSAVSPDADRADVQEGLQWSGASFYIFVYMMVLGVQAIALTFPFALGFSATRRDFWLGTSLTFVLLSAIYAAGMTVLALIEVATGGWGLGGRMFTALYFGGDATPWFARFFLFFATFLFFFFVGALAAVIYQRWRVNGMLIFFGALTVALVGGVALITFSESWPAVGAWFVETGASGVVAWSLVPTGLAALVGYAILRRTTPKNT
ncbi:hypothetical protein [Herbiconiux sp.]|uniref:hypothetical protein n=1 Tax=Herbiconiux sp. TaxID=1871186 RepID=UPI0025C22BA2|nr:hypothetical protein [Herbiconiux sp.]